MSGATPDCLTTAPPGARLPNRIARPPSFENGLSQGRIDLGVAQAGVLEQRPGALAGHRHRREVEQPALGQLGHHGRDAAGGVDVLEVPGARGGDVAQAAHLAAELVEGLQLEREARLVRDGGQVQHRVRGGAERHVDRDGVGHRLLRHDVARADVPAQQLHDLHPGVLGQAAPRGGHRGDRAVAGQAEADRLGQAVHRVGREHPRAGAAGRAGAVLHLGELRGAHLLRLDRADPLEDRDQVDRLAAVAAGEHRPAADDDGRDVQAQRGHDHAGDDLVAVGDQHERVERLRHAHDLDRVGDQLAAGERVLHARGGSSRGRRRRR